MLELAALAKGISRCGGGGDGGRDGGGGGDDGVGADAVDGAAGGNGSTRNVFARLVEDASRCR